MKWTLKYLPEAVKDLQRIDNSIRPAVEKGIRKVLQNPLPKSEGGYGTPLGNKDNNNLTKLYKIKFKKYGIRVVYALQYKNNQIIIIVVSVREDNQVYHEAGKRLTILL